MASFGTRVVYERTDCHTIGVGIGLQELRDRVGFRKKPITPFLDARKTFACGI